MLHTLRVRGTEVVGRSCFSFYFWGKREGRRDRCQLHLDASLSTQSSDNNILKSYMYLYLFEHLTRPVHDRKSPIVSIQSEAPGLVARLALEPPYPHARTTSQTPALSTCAAPSAPPQSASAVPSIGSSLSSSDCSEGLLPSAPPSAQIASLTLLAQRYPPVGMPRTPACSTVSATQRRRWS